MEEKEGLKNTVTSHIKNYLYYIIIGVISFVSLVFLPMVGTINVGWNFPTDAAGWFIWITIRIMGSIINVLIFHSFIKQAKVNVKDNDKYKEAVKMLYTCKPKNYIPRSPSKFFGGEYLKKGICIFLITSLSLVALTMAFLYFNWIMFLSYLFTIIFGIALGVLEMLRVEEYWTNEFYDFALKKVREREETEQESVKGQLQAEEVEKPQENSQC